MADPLDHLFQNARRIQPSPELWARIAADASREMPFQAASPHRSLREATSRPSLFLEGLLALAAAVALLAFPVFRPFSDPSSLATAAAFDATLASALNPAEERPEILDDETITWLASLGEIAY